MLAGTPAGARGSALLSADLAATAGDALPDPAEKPKAKKPRKRKAKAGAGDAGGEEDGAADAGVETAKPAKKPCKRKAKAGVDNAETGGDGAVAADENAAKPAKKPRKRKPKAAAVQSPPQAEGKLYATCSEDSSSPDRGVVNVNEARADDADENAAKPAKKPRKRKPKAAAVQSPPQAADKLYATCSEDSSRPDKVVVNVTEARADNAGVNAAEPAKKPRKRKLKAAAVQSPPQAEGALHRAYIARSCNSANDGEAGGWMLLPMLARVQPSQPRSPANGSPRPQLCRVPLKQQARCLCRM